MVGERTGWRVDIQGEYGYVAPNKNSDDDTEVFSTRTHTSAGVIGSSEDTLEIDFLNGKISRVGDQYGIRSDRAAQSPLRRGACPCLSRGQTAMAELSCAEAQSLCAAGSRDVRTKS